MDTLHYIIPASLNDSRERKCAKRTRARRHNLKTQNLTFRELKKSFHVRMEPGREQSEANLLSALNAFMAEQGFSDETIVASILRASFYKQLTKHLRKLTERGKTQAYIANRKSYLSHWHRFTVMLDREAYALSGKESPFVSALKGILDSAPIKRIARQVGISPATLKRWLDGASPNERALPALGRLEMFFGLPPGELVLLSGLRGELSAKPAEAEPIAHRCLLRQRCTEQSQFTGASPELRQEWLKFLAYKCAPVPAPGKPRQRTGKWSASKFSGKKQRKAEWYCYQGDQFVASASIAWRLVAKFYGYLSRPLDDGGMGISEDELQTLAHLTDLEALVSFSNWQIARSGDRINQGLINWVAFVKSLVHPQTGYLTKSPEIGTRAGVLEADWKDRCTSVFSYYKENMHALSRQQEATRDSFEPLKSVLELKNPLDAVADAVQRMNAARPRTGGSREALWARDRLLIKLLASNPIRAKNMKLLKILPPGKPLSPISGDSGTLYADSDGGWRIRIGRKFLKNFNGAARDQDYDMPVNATLWEEIEEFVSQHRPQIAAPGNPYLFTTHGSEGPMYSLNRRVESLTRKYFWRCPGFGPHGFRHIVATAILKSSPNDWATTAMVLYDKEETVRKHYAHLKSQDGAARQFEILQSSYARM